MQVLTQEITAPPRLRPDDLEEVYVKINGLVDRVEEQFQRRNGRLPNLADSADLLLLAEQLEGDPENPFVEAQSPQARADRAEIDRRAIEAIANGREVNDVLADSKDLFFHYFSNEAGIHTHDCGHELLRRFLDRYPEGCNLADGEDKTPLFSRLPRRLRSRVFHVYRGIAPRTFEGRKEGKQAARMRAFREDGIPLMKRENSHISEEYLVAEIKRTAALCLKVRECFASLKGEIAEIVDKTLGDSVINPCASPNTYTSCAFRVYGEKLEALEKFYEGLGI